jgi:hypothetical protein
MKDNPNTTADKGRTSTTGSAFHEWWNATGSGIEPNQGEDHEEHCSFVALAAWNAAGSTAALGKRGAMRLEDITSTLTRFEHTLRKRTEGAEDEELEKLDISVEDAWRILDVISFVQALPQYLQNACLSHGDDSATLLHEKS